MADKKNRLVMRMTGGCAVVLAALAGTAAAQVSGGGDAASALRNVSEGVVAHRDLAYVEGGHERQKLDLYLPSGAQGPLPLIIWVHGGGWQAGSKDGCPPLRQGFVSRGYAVASVGYRLSGDAVFPAQIEDCKAAVRWLRAHAKEYGLDPDRFGVWGSSAGGHLVALLGTSGGDRRFDVGPCLGVSSRVQAVCDYFGPTDLTQMDAHAVAGARLKHDDAKSPEACLIGGPVQENKDKAARASPITYVTGTNAMPPFLIVHGDADPVVPHHQSELLFDALAKAGGNVHLRTVKGAGHGQGFGRDLDALAAEFFDKWLKSSPRPTATSAASQSECAATTAPQRQGPAAAQDTISRGRPRVSFEQVRRHDDADGDGRVTRAEFKGPAPVFQRLDRNGDGVLTSEDFKDAP